ncbi:MAG: hypothetical protein CVV51_09725 [Spirochaetae bacterium HGW-Spirochaetae-7]|jgi:hypothetical protein|nr:MAG: hypothetical protein CVV51_09725 [Spirochaetae bacterium HGW-Spirochaetae-7]
MFRFFLSRSFHDLWDNMMAVACFNGAALAITAAGITLATRFESISVRILSIALIVFGAAYWCAVASFAFSEVADFKSVKLETVRRALAKALVPGMQLGAMLTLAITSAATGLRFYSALGGFIGAFAASLLFWLLASLCLMLQYYLPAKAGGGGGFIETMKLSFLLFIDAPLFAVALFLYGVVCIALSPMVAFLLPGPAAALLAGCEAYRLRMHRLRWLKASGGTATGPTPWKELLAQDREEFGERKLKDLLFPWRR